ncbi:MAG: RNA 2',3'-cyclic phosphodiesterase [Desulfosarcina sp.]|jgi:2'-5' RNA ligase
MKETLRAFIAVPIPNAMADFLQQVQVRLTARRINIRWVAAGNIHLTLKFLGDIGPRQVAEVASRMDAAGASATSFALRASGVGVFPNRRRARVLWVGLDGDLERLRVLQQDLESRLAAAGFDRSARAYRAHLTIGRARRPVPAKILAELLEPVQHVASDPFRVDRLVLFRSLLKPTGARYVRLHTAHLTQ